MHLKPIQNSFKVTFIFTLLTLSCAISQITGIVRDLSEEPLENCSIRLTRDETELATTDALGQFTVDVSSPILSSVSKEFIAKWSSEKLILQNLPAKNIKVTLFDNRGKWVASPSVNPAKNNLVVIEHPMIKQGLNFILQLKLDEALVNMRWGDKINQALIKTNFSKKTTKSANDTLRISCHQMASEYIPLTSTTQDAGVINMRPPNVIIILLDDAGYGDFSYTGQTAYQTPAIDNLAQNGMRFDNSYVPQAACSASRAALLTGVHPSRFKFPWVISPTSTRGLPENELTIAEMLKSKNYQTAIFGKWHLGNKPEAWPLNHGFDEFLGLPRSADYTELSLIEADQYIFNYDGHAMGPNIGRGGGTGPLGGPAYLDTTAQEMFTTWWTEKSVEFINTNKDKPFFLYMPHNQPHVGLFVSDKYRDQSGVGLYGDVMMELDWSVGEIIKALKENDIAKKTLVLFTSDNGPWDVYGNHSGSVGPFKPGYAKRNSHEGGIHAPGIAWWPDHIIPGVSSLPIQTIDYLPTIAALSGGELPDHNIDGMDLSEHLLGLKSESEYPLRNIYFYNNQTLEAIRYGKWKFHFSHGTSHLKTVGNDGKSGTYENIPQPEAIYNLETDVTESNNLISSHRALADSIKQAAQTFNSLVQNDPEHPPQDY